MSTKATIINNKSYHLYEEAFDNDNVYLDLEDLSGCCFEIWEEGDQMKTHATITIPIKAWRNIVKAWSKSSWSADSTRDGSKVILDNEILKRISYARSKFDDL